MRGSLVEWEGDDRAGPAGRVSYQLDFGRLCFVVHPNWEQDYPSRIVYRKPAGREIIPYIRMTLLPTRRSRSASSSGNGASGESRPTDLICYTRTLGRKITYCCIG